MHQHLAHPPAPEPPPSLLDNLSDTLLNAFAKVRKPDERFVEVKDGLDKFEEGLTGMKRIEDRTKTRLGGRRCLSNRQMAASNKIFFRSVN